MTIDSTIKKIDSKHSPIGEMGQKYLSSGTSLAMRLWQEEQPVHAADRDSRQP